ncbi:hypothetical protein Tco_1479960, partial [Tanacetum coccineum]
ILDTKGAVPTNTTADAKKAIQEMAEYSQKWHNGISRGRSTETSNGLAAIQAQLNNLGREIKKVNAKVYAAQERGFGSLPSSTKTNLRDQVKSISTTIEADSYSICHIGSSQYAVSTGQNSILLYKSRKITVPFLSHLDNHYCEEEEGNYGPKFVEAYGASHIDKSIPQKEKDLGSFTLPCFINNVCFDNALVDLGASVSVRPLLTYLNLGLGELAHIKLTVELAYRTVKYPKGIAKNVLFKRKNRELDLEVRLMGETLLLNRSLDPFLEDYIELNDLNEPFELLRRNQGDDLMPTIKEGEVIEEFRTRDGELDTRIDALFIVTMIRRSI